ncbi:MAG: hydroxyectoine utilization dehydratase EutB [Gammaproteobacteria bacterium]|nr:hydroxyectoine utilization dehydratase EutB [Gammaproteobacteria bacterium]
MPQITVDHVRAAQRAISPWVRPTPVVLSGSLSARSGSSVYLKLETVHDSGAFKIRGATNKLASLTEEERGRGVVTVSTGNHGRAVALAASRLGVPATVCVSELVPENKREAIRVLGAKLHVEGASQDDAEKVARKLAEDKGLVPVHPFDDPHVIAGQGTIGLELLADLGRVDHVLIGLSGGGLASGVALALKSAFPDTRVIGVSMERGPAMIESIRAGRPVAVEESPSLADSLGGGIGLGNRYTFDLVREYVDEFVLLDERQIADGMKHLYREERIIAEGGGAVPVAALLHDKVQDFGGNVVCIISGGNVNMDEFTRVVTDRYEF